MADDTNDNSDMMKSLMDRKAALKDANDNADVGTRPQAKATPAPTATPKDSGKPDQWNTPKRDGETMEQHVARLAVLRSAWAEMHPRTP